METTLFIIPAYFLKYQGETAIIICYVGDTKTGKPIIQKRKFDKILIDHITKPTKIFIGIDTKPGSKTLTYACGKHYRLSFTWTKDYFKK